MGRFLVERAGFANTPPLLGTIEMSLRAAGEAAEAASTIAMGVLFGFVRNQGDGWTMALNYLSRYLDDALNEAAPGAAPPDQDVELPDPDHFFLGLARQLGLRTGEMHRALAEFGGDDPAFAPEPITARRYRRVAAGIAGIGRGHVRPAWREPRAAARAGARARRPGDRRARSARRSDPAAGARQHLRGQVPAPRRLSPGTGARGAERFLHHRFRGRAVAAGGAAPAQEFAAARRRRDDPLVRLRRERGGAADRRNATGRGAARRRARRGLAAARGRPASAPPTARRRAARRSIRPTNCKGRHWWISSRSKRPSTK